MPAVTLIRHGQASFGKANYDQPSELGYLQAHRLGISLKERDEPVDVVYVGAMQRHLQTAETCLAAAELKLPLQTLPGFNEFNHEQVLERFEPRYLDKDWLASEMARHENPSDAFADMFRTAITRWVSGQHDDEYDETWTAFQQRCRQSLHDVITKLSGKQQALVFTSGGSISVIAQELLQLNDVATFRVNWTLANGGLTRILQGKRHRNLVSLNEHNHFSGRYRQLLTYR